MSSIQYRGNDASTVKRTSHLSAMLSDYVAEEIHYRLDRLYLETIHAGSSSSDAMDETTSTALEEELEALYPEIEILAEMSTRQQFHEPILRELLNEHDKLRMASQEKLEQVRGSSSVVPLISNELIHTFLGTRHVDRDDFVKARSHKPTRGPGVVLGAVRTASRVISIRSRQRARYTAVIPTGVSATPIVTARPPSCSHGHCTCSCPTIP